jgi:ABC-type multidrug transport system fused ATPase/permease subunit
MALTVTTAAGVGHAVVDRALPSTWWWTTAVGLVALRSVLTWREMDMSHALAYRVLARLRSTVFDAYARGPAVSQREHSGRAAAVTMDGIERLEFFYAHTVAQIGAAGVVFAGSVCLTTVILPAAGVLVAVGGVLVLGASLGWSRTTRRLGAGQNDARERLSIQIVDSLGALREILSYGLTANVVEASSTITREASSIHRRSKAAHERGEAVRDVIVSAITVGVIGVASWAAGVLGGVDGPNLSPGSLPPLAALALAGVSAASDAATTLSRLHPLTADARRVSRAINVQSPVSSPTTTQPAPSGALGLRFDRVHFAHTGRHPVLTDWQWSVEPGEHVGVAGPSGSGKSTVLSLAGRLHLPTAGRIMLIGATGETPLDAVSESDLRRIIALVDQDSTMFGGTVRDNLLRGTDRRPDSALLDALSRVGMIGRVDLDDELGQSGLRLSGGQRARLALARALIREPKILLVDEVTASLDQETERIISDVLAAFPGTVVIASHRHETLARLDRVIEIPAQEKVNV